MELKLQTLETERLLLRKLKETDYLDLFEIRSDESLNRHIDVQIEKTIDQTLKYIDKINVGIVDSKWLLWGVEEKLTHHLIGTVSLWQFKDDYKVCEIGYVTQTKYHGKGYTKEAIEAVLTYGFQKLKLKQINAYTEIQNEPSNLMLQRLGFVYLETIEEEGFHKKRTFHMNVYKKSH